MNLKRLGMTEEDFELLYEPYTGKTREFIKQSEDPVKLLSFYVNSVIKDGGSFQVKELEEIKCLFRDRNGSFAVLKVNKKPDMYVDKDLFTSTLGRLGYRLRGDFVFDLFSASNDNVLSLDNINKMAITKQDILKLINRNNNYSIKNLLSLFSKYATRNYRIKSNYVFVDDVIKMILALKEEMITKDQLVSIFLSLEEIKEYQEDVFINVSYIEEELYNFEILRYCYDDENIITFENLKKMKLEDRSNDYFKFLSLESLYRSLDLTVETRNVYVTLNDLLNNKSSIMTLSIDFSEEERLDYLPIVYDREKEFDSVYRDLEEMHSKYAFLNECILEYNTYMDKNAIPGNVNIYLYFILINGILMSNLGLFSYYLTNSISSMKECKESMKTFVNVAIQYLKFKQEFNSEEDYFEHTKELSNAISICVMFYESNRISNLTFIEFFDNLLEKLESTSNLSLDTLFPNLTYYFKYVIPREVREEIDNVFPIDFLEDLSDMSDITNEEYEYNQCYVSVNSRIHLSYLQSKFPKEVIDYFLLASSIVDQKTINAEFDTPSDIDKFSYITSDFLEISRTVYLKIMKYYNNGKFANDLLDQIKEVLKDITEEREKLFTFLKFDYSVLLDEQIKPSKNVKTIPVVNVEEIKEELDSYNGIYVNNRTLFEYLNRVSRYVQEKSLLRITDNNEPVDDYPQELFKALDSQDLQTIYDFILNLENI